MTRLKIILFMLLSSLALVAFVSCQAKASERTEISSVFNIESAETSPKLSMDPKLSVDVYDITIEAGKEVFGFGESYILSSLSFSNESANLDNTYKTLLIGISLNDCSVATCKTGWDAWRYKYRATSYKNSYFAGNLDILKPEVNCRDKLFS